MAYGNVVGYEPTPEPGTYRFTDKAGGSWTMFGESAAVLKRRLDASQALMPQPTAGLNPNGTSQPRVATDAPAPVPGMPAPAPRMGTTTVDVPRDEQGRTVEERTAAPAAPAGPAGFTSAGPGIFKGPDGRYYEYRAGSAASKGGLVLRGETRQGVQPVDPEFLEAQDDLQIDRRLELQNQQDAQLAQAEQLRQHKEEMAVIAANEQAEAARRQQEVDKQVADLQGRYDKAEKEIAGSKVNPNATFLEALVTGLGTAGSILTKQPNLANEIVQRQIDRRIAAQEHEINIKRETKNDLAKMLEVTKGNRDLARQALSTAYAKKAAATFEARAANTSNQELKATMGLAALNMQDAYLMRRKAWEDAGRGEVTQSFVNTPAHAGSAGGLVPVGDQLGTESRILANETAAAKNNAAKATAAPGKLDSATAKQVAGLDAGISAIRRLKQRHVERGLGGGGITGGALDSEDAQWAAEVDAAVPLIDAAKQGGAPNESTMGALKDGLKSVRGKKIEAALIAEEKILQDRRQSLIDAASGAAPAEETTE